MCPVCACVALVKFRNFFFLAASLSLFAMSTATEFFTFGKGYHNERDSLTTEELAKTIEVPVKRYGPYTEAQLDELKVPPHLRDQCVAHALKLNECRREYNFFPLGKCDDLKVRYERCQYKQLRWVGERRQAKNYKQNCCVAAAAVFRCLACDNTTNCYYYYLLRN